MRFAGIKLQLHDSTIIFDIDHSVLTKTVETSAGRSRQEDVRDDASPPDNSIPFDFHGDSFCPRVLVPVRIDVCFRSCETLRFCAI